ncbi:MAG: hypothetical protein HY911_00615 [Desulfobacterales bacterium]|nr:hypothetical protein [Desulfobacterales bacterium]
MISERTFARSFPAFWSDLLPLLTPRFVHLINVGFCHNLKNESDSSILPIKKSIATRDPAVVSEFAFILSKLSLEKKIDIDGLAAIKELTDQAEYMAYEIVEKYEGGEISLSLPLLQEEKEEGIALARNYQIFLNQYCKDQPIEFGPIIQGSGFLSKCRADISVGKTLFEVKTVDRNLAGKDIRQLIVYLSLQSATGNSRWERAGFFNPRKSIFHEFSVHEIIQQMAGGRSAPDVFRELIDFIARREVEIDSKF